MHATHLSSLIEMATGAGIELDMFKTNAYLAGAEPIDAVRFEYPAQVQALQSGASIEVALLCFSGVRLEGLFPGIHKIPNYFEAYSVGDGGLSFEGE